MRKRLIVPIVLMIVSAAAACGILAYTKSAAGSPHSGMNMQQGGEMPGGEKSNRSNNPPANGNGQNQQNSETAPPALPSGEKPSGTPPEIPSGENGKSENHPSDSQRPTGNNDTAPGSLSQDNMKSGHPSINIPTIISFGLCSVIFAFGIFYLILSRFGKETVLTDTKKKKLILSIGTIGLGTLITVCLTLLSNFAL